MYKQVLFTFGENKNSLFVNEPELQTCTEIQFRRTQMLGWEGAKGWIDNSLSNYSFLGEGATSMRPNTFLKYVMLCWEVTEIFIFIFDRMKHKYIITGLVAITPLPGKIWGGFIVHDYLTLSSCWANPQMIKENFMGPDLVLKWMMYVYLSFSALKLWIRVSWG